MNARRKFQEGRRHALALTVIIPMLIAALILTGGIWAIGALAGLRWYWWVVASPLLYIVWLMLFLRICAGNSERIGSRHPKPRHLLLQATGEGTHTPQPSAATVIICMFRCAFITSVPLVHGLAQLSSFRRLILRSYSPSVHIGERAAVWGLIMDPDLTEIGKGAVVGWSSEVIAHTYTQRPDGSVVYLSAPIKIGAGATVGGKAYVALGAVIGDGAVVEPMSFVEPFTVIPPGETWGGVPARRLRKRGEDPGAQERRPAARTSEAEFEQARRLVAFALGLQKAEVPQELSTDSCAAWDSLGQIAIATALFDSYGVAVGNDRLYRLRTLDDVADAIAGRARVPEKRAGTMRTAEDALPADLEMLPLSDPAAATRALAGRFLDQPATATPLRVVIAASATAQPLAATMKVWGRAFGWELDCEFAGFNQIAQTLLTDHSQFAANSAGVNVILVDPSDRMFDSAKQTSGAVEELLEALETWQSKQPQGAQTLVGTLPPLVSAFAAVDRSEYEQLRHAWRARIEKMPGVQMFDFGAVVEQVGVTAARDSGSEVLSRMPYSSTLYQVLGIALVRQILATRRSPAKVIAVDCDNTLWGGVVGEVGLDGIQLGSDGAGRSFQLFQRYLRQLKERGLLLVVVSRNEEADVLRVFENHPEMVLRADDIAAWRVNWKHKSENLQELAEELNLGIDSFVFLDDDAAVRTEVSMRVPGVHVVPLPEDSARYCETLERLWLFDGAQATEADRKRTRMMQEESQRQRTRKTAASLDDYLASLELEVDIREPGETEWARVAQLTQRTNQFNLSLKRRTLEEVKALAVSGSVRILKARDRFGDYGLVGACVFRKAESASCEIDTLLMSCRVLGRGVEDAFLHAIGNAAAAQGASRLVAPFVEGPRNQLVKDFLARSGFQETQPNTWVLPVAEISALPKHVRWVGREEHLAAL